MQSSLQQTRVGSTSLPARRHVHVLASPNLRMQSAGVASPHTGSHCACQCHTGSSCAAHRVPSAAAGRRRVLVAAAPPGAMYEGAVMAHPGAKFAIVVARFNSLITKGLLDGAQEAFSRHGASHVDVVWVPGSFELPVVASSMARSGKYSAILCIGAVVKGATAHYDAVVNATTSGILNAGLSTGVPVVFGVLTCDNMEQALDRTGGKVGNKGYECAVTTVETANLMFALRADGVAAPPTL